MPAVKRIVCLANSRKLGGRCVAGKELSGGSSGQWIRPVGDREHGELFVFERQYRDGGEPVLLDVMDVALQGHKPHSYQRENWLLESRKRIEKVGRLERSDLRSLLDPVQALWLNGHSTANGMNDQVPSALTEGLTGSLRLIPVEELVLSVLSYYQRRKVLGAFKYDETVYRLSVTDPSYEEPYRKRADGDYKIGPSVLCISLGEPFIQMNSCYKLIAGIVELKDSSI